MMHRASFMSILVALLAVYPLLAELIKSNVAGNKVKTIGNSEHQYTARDYVQDGLVAHFDGIENVGYGMHDASSTAWNCLIDENRKMPTTLQSLHWEDDALVRDGVDGIIYDMGIDMSNPLSTRTFEFVVSYEANELYTDKAYYFLRCDYIGFRVLFNRDAALAITLRAGGGYVSTPFAQPQFKGSISLVGTDIPYISNPIERAYAHYYANGSRIGTGSFGGNPSSSMLLDLFSPRQLYPSSNVMKIYAIRIYNRALTVDEIMHNYAIDKKRFGL